MGIDLAASVSSLLHDRLSMLLTMDADRGTILLIERLIGFKLEINRLSSAVVTLSEETHADPSSSDGASIELLSMQ
jgi:hypothetical protein